MNIPTWLWFVGILISGPLGTFIVSKTLDWWSKRMNKEERDMYYRVMDMGELSISYTKTNRKEFHILKTLTKKGYVHEHRNGSHYIYFVE